jgi:hypothetical protein
MNRKRLVVIAASMAVVAVLAVGGFATVFAAGSPTPTTSGSTQTSRAQTFLDRLANNLGISTDKLQQGLKDTADQYVDQAQQNGKITPQQAAQAKQKIADGNGLNAFTRFFAKRSQRLGMLRQASWNDIATALNTTPQDLKAQIESGQTLQQIIQSKNMTVDQVVSTVVNDVKAKLDPKVASGAITAQQEQNVLDNLRAGLTNLINSGGPIFPQHTAPSAPSA